MKLKIVRAIRSVIKTLRFSEAEYALARKLASQYDVPFSEWSRQAILKWRPKRSELVRKR